MYFSSTCALIIPLSSSFTASLLFSLTAIPEPDLELLKAFDIYTLHYCTFYTVHIYTQYITTLLHIIIQRLLFCSFSRNASMLNTVWNGTVHTQRRGEPQGLTYNVRSFGSLLPGELQWEQQAVPWTTLPLPKDPYCQRMYTDALTCKNSFGSGKRTRSQWVCGWTKLWMGSQVELKTSLGFSEPLP